MIALVRDYILGGSVDMTQVAAPTIFAPLTTIEQRSARESRRDYLHVRRAFLIVESDRDGTEDPVALAYVRTGSQLLFRTLAQLSEIE
jgi:hypothetical protein